jgi:hypothetical protein
MPLTSARENLTGLSGDPAWSWCAIADTLLAAQTVSAVIASCAQESRKMKSQSQSPFDLAMGLPPARERPVPLSVRIGIARELLVVLTEATRSGQRHLMCRVLDILQVDILRPSVRLTHPQVAAVMAAVAELQHEAARAAPDIALFCARARIVIDILTIA